MIVRPTEVPAQAPPHFSDAEVSQARPLASSQITASTHLLRARLILLLHEQPDIWSPRSPESARQLGQSPSWVYTWRRRWDEMILDLSQGLWKRRPLDLDEQVVPADEKTSIQARRRRAVAPGPGRPRTVCSLRFLSQISWSYGKAGFQGVEPTRDLSTFSSSFVGLKTIP